MNDGRKRKPQKHQNKTAYKIQFQPLAMQIHKKVSFTGLCKRCLQVIEWKIKYNKYKKMTQPSRCRVCQNKNVLRTYMIACDKCCQDLGVCPKCLQKETEEQKIVKLNAKQQKKLDQQTENNMNAFIKKLKERSRRKVRRQYDKGTIDWDNQLQNFVDEQGNVVTLHFRQAFGGVDEDWQDEENDDDDDEDMSGDQEQGDENNQTA